MPAAQYIAKTGPIFKGADSLSLTFSWIYLQLTRVVRKDVASMRQDEAIASSCFLVPR